MRLCRPIPELSQKDVDRFMSKCKQNRDKNYDGGFCIEWQGQKGKFGYGLFKIGKQKYFAHRVVCSIFLIDLPIDKEVNHLCNNRSCQNPGHFDITNHIENLRYARDNFKGVGTQILTRQQAIEIKTRISLGENYKVLAIEFGVASKTVYNIMRGDKWKDVLPELNSIHSSKGASLGE